MAPARALKADEIRRRYDEGAGVKKLMDITGRSYDSIQSILSGSWYDEPQADIRKTGGANYVPWFVRNARAVQIELQEVLHAS